LLARLLHGLAGLALGRVDLKVPSGVPDALLGMAPTNPAKVAEVTGDQEDDPMGRRAVLAAVPAKPTCDARQLGVDVRYRRTRKLVGARPFAWGCSTGGLTGGGCEAPALVCPW
jgi:hypothetical protein